MSNDQEDIQGNFDMRGVGSLTWDTPTVRRVMSYVVQESELWGLGSLHWVTNVFLAVTVAAAGFILGCLWDLAITPDANQELAWQIINFVIAVFAFAGTITLVTFFLVYRRINKIKKESVPRDEFFKDNLT